MPPILLAVDKTYPKGLMWFRRDLRAYDNAALYHALRSCRQVLCVFVFDTAILDALPGQDAQPRDDGLRDEDRKFIQKQIVPGLGDIARAKEFENVITAVRTFAEEGIGKLLVSEDSKATLVLVVLSTTLYGMPIFSPSQRPDPKSALRLRLPPVPAVLPEFAIQVALLVCAGRLVTLARQNALTGVMAQLVPGKISPGGLAGP